MAWLIGGWVGFNLIMLSFPETGMMVHVCSVREKTDPENTMEIYCFNYAAVVEHAGHPSAHLAVAPSLDNKNSWGHHTCT